MGLTVRSCLADWIPVERELPHVEKINGFWSTTPVAVALEDGRVTGAFFSYNGGDAMDVDDNDNPLPEPRKPEPSFETDEGLAYVKVTHWQYLPKHPKDCT